MPVTRSCIYKNDSNITTTSTKEQGLTDLLGKLRASKEVTEIGCLLMLVGLAEVIQPTTWLAGLVNGSPTEAGTTDTKGLPFSTLMGYVLCVAIGVVTVLIGYAAAFPQQSPQHQFPSSKGAKLITTSSAIFVQTAYVLTVSTCMTVARIAIDGKSFLRSSSAEPPPVLEDQPNNRLLAAMGVLLILSYWFGMLGSISVLLGSLGKFQSGQGHERDGRYYGSRLFFYSFILWLGGAAQTIIGVHLEMTHDTKGGPITDNGSAFYKVAMLVVSYPSMSIAVGALQVFNGTWGMLRKVGWVPRNGNVFVWSIWFGWMAQLVIQILVQPSILPGVAGLREPPELTAFCFGINFMPAFLDSKSCSLPESIEPQYYSEGNTSGVGVDHGHDDNYNDEEQPDIRAYDGPERALSHVE